MLISYHYAVIYSDINILCKQYTAIVLAYLYLINNKYAFSLYCRYIVYGLLLFNVNCCFFTLINYNNNIADLLLN